LLKIMFGWDHHPRIEAGCNNASVNVHLQSKRAREIIIAKLQWWLRWWPVFWSGYTADSFGQS
jgi:hypothetical protein